MTIDMESMAQSLEAIKDELIRHHAWTEDHFNNSKFPMERRLDELEKRLELLIDYDEPQADD